MQRTFIATLLCTALLTTALIAPVWAQKGVEEQTQTEAVETQTVPASASTPSTPPASGSAPMKGQPEDQAKTYLNLELEHRFIELERRLLDREADTVNWWLTYVVGFLTVFLTALLLVFAFIGLASKKTLEDIKEEAKEYLQRIREHEQEAKDKVENILTAKDVDENPAEAQKDIQRVKDNPNASILDKASAEALRLQEQGKIPEAIEKWKSIANIMQDSDNLVTAQAWFSVGYLYQERSDLPLKEKEEKAIEYYTKAIELKPDYTLAYNNRGVAKYRKGDLDGAIVDYDKAIAFKADFALAYNNRGNAKSEQGDLDGAIADYTIAITLKPDDAKAYANRGVAYLKLGNEQKAEENMKQGIQHLPKAKPQLMALKQDAEEELKNMTAQGEKDKILDYIKRAISEIQKKIDELNE